MENTNQELTNNKNEDWKDIIGYEGLYRISNLGNVKSLAKQRGFKNEIAPDIILHKFLSKQNGYFRCSLVKNGLQKSVLIHRLVADAFLDNPNNKRTVNHFNGIRNDNRVENLEWCTYSENNIHAIVSLNKKSPKPKGNNSCFSKPIAQYTLTMELIKIHVGGTHEIKRIYNYNQGNISACARGLRKKANGFIWKYLS